MSIGTKVQLKDAQPGDLVFCNSVGPISKGIKFVQWIKPEYREWKDYNHVATLKSKRPTGDWNVYQAEGRGVTDTGLLSTLAPGGSYIIVRPPGSNVAYQLKFLQEVVDANYRYGFVVIASILVTILLPFEVVNVMMPHSYVCSALASMGIRMRGDYMPDDPDIYQVTPSGLLRNMLG